jgi:hypothetical protein
MRLWPSSTWSTWPSAHKLPLGGPGFEVVPQGSGGVPLRLPRLQLDHLAIHSELSGDTYSAGAGVRRNLLNLSTPRPHDVGSASQTAHIRESVCQHRGNIWRGPSNSAARPGHEPGGIGTCQRISPQLHWASGKGREEPFSADAIQFGRRANNFPVRCIEAG